MDANEEWAGVNRQPKTPTVIEGFNYPKPVKSLIKKLDAAYASWAEADTALYGAEDDVLSAKAEDAKAFAESVLNGTDDPGEVHTPVALRKLQGAQILAEARRREVNAIGRELEQLFRKHIREIGLEAIRQARQGISDYERLMLQAAQIAVQASESRNDGLTGLRFLSHYTRGVYSFDAGFPLNGFATFPNTREERIVKIADDLERLIEDGQLFGEIEESA
jgi:hypothetical protein